MKCSHILFSLFALLVLSGCGSTIVDYRVELTVDQPGEIAYVDGPGTENPFPDAVFIGETLRFQVEVSSLMMRFIIDNRSSEPVVLDWSRATIATNHRPDPVALRARLVAVGDEIAGFGRGVEPGTVMRLAIGGGARGFASFQPNFTGLFPGDRVFGLRLAGKREIQDAGFGNRILLQVPIVSAGHETLYMLEFVARDARARVSYY